MSIYAAAGLIGLACGAAFFAVIAKIVVKTSRENGIKKAMPVAEVHHSSARAESGVREGAALTAL